MTSRAIVIVGWAVLAAALVGCGLLPYLARRRVATLFELARRLTRRRLGFAAAFVGWLWIGWHFFVR